MNDRADSKQATQLSWVVTLAFVLAGRLRGLTPRLLIRVNVLTAVGRPRSISFVALVEDAAVLSRRAVSVFAPTLGA
jgi:hypothetical protein